MSVFYHSILSAEKEKNSIADIMYIFYRVHKLLNERKDQVFKPLKVREILKLKEEDAGSISHSVVKSFESELLEVYKNAVNYLEKWLHQYKEFKVFYSIKIDFNNLPCWEMVEETLIHLNSLGYTMDDGLCFDQFCNFLSFTKKEAELFEK